MLVYAMTRLGHVDKAIPFRIATRVVFHVLSGSHLECIDDAVVCITLKRIPCELYSTPLIWAHINALRSSDILQRTQPQTAYCNFKFSANP
jgi:hypothetical protein